MDHNAVFDALGDPTRRQILELVAKQPRPVQEIALAIGRTKGAVSQQLKRLASAGLVARAVGKKGQRLWYQLEAGGLAAATDYLATLQKYQSGSPAQLRRPEEQTDISVEHCANCLEKLTDDAQIETLIDPALSRLLQEAQATPKYDPLALTLTTRLQELGELMRQSVESVSATVGLTVWEMLFLGSLFSAGPPYERSPGELMRTFWVSAPGVSGRIARLELLGLVARRQHPEDRRRVVIGLTFAGQTAVRDIMDKSCKSKSYVVAARLSRGNQILMMHMLSRVLSIFHSIPRSTKPNRGIQEVGGHV